MSHDLSGLYSFKLSEVLRKNILRVYRRYHGLVPMSDIVIMLSLTY